MDYNESKEGFFLRSCLLKGKKLKSYIPPEK